MGNPRNIPVKTNFFDERKSVDRAVQCEYQNKPRDLNRYYKYSIVFPFLTHACCEDYSVNHSQEILRTSMDYSLKCYLNLSPTTPILGLSNSAAN